MHRLFLLFLIMGCSSGGDIEGTIEGVRVSFDYAEYGVIIDPSYPESQRTFLRVYFEDTATGTWALIDAVREDSGNPTPASTNAPGGAMAVWEFAMDVSSVSNWPSADARAPFLEVNGPIEGQLRFGSLLTRADAEGHFTAQHSPALDDNDSR